MDFSHDIPTRVFFGRKCLHKNKEHIAHFGRKALIVCGKTGAKASGAYEDAVDVLDELHIGYQTYDNVLNNPSLENVKEGGDFARAYRPDFIFAIGGGSPLDGAKAISALFSNDMEPMDLIEHPERIKQMVPVLAIPTTAGTGSEVTPYSVLTVPGLRTKKSFASYKAYPAVAFLDYRYTESLPEKIAVDTALDAFTHLLESYLSKKCNPMVETFSLSGISHFAECVSRIKESKFDEDVRMHLMYASLMGGLAIAHTGTTFLHAMGYSLTYFKGMSHGNANALLTREYLRYNYPEAREKIDRILGLLGFDCIDALGDFFEGLVEGIPGLLSEELAEFAGLSALQNSIRNGPREIGIPEMTEIYRRTFTKI
ncbi:MAG: iron-containing alcohol dehydrogenase family protein [Clostridia bacterium]